MTNRPERDTATRRDFLKVAAVAAPAAAAATVVAPGAAQAEIVEGDDRMQDTAHTRAYFDSARF